MDVWEQRRIRYRWPAVVAGAAIAVASTVGMIDSMASSERYDQGLDAKCVQIADYGQKVACHDEAARAKEVNDMNEMLPAMGLFLLASAGVGLLGGGVAGMGDRYSLKTSQPPLPMSGV